MRPPLPDPNDFGDRWEGFHLREWRKARKISQVQLGEVLGVSSTTISNWENDLFQVPPYLHLACQGIDFHLSFASRPPASVPPQRRQFKPVPPQLRPIGLVRTRGRLRKDS